MLFVVLSCYPPYVSVEGYIVCCFFLCPVTDISATVTPIGLKFCMMVHIGPGQTFSLLGGYTYPKSKIVGRNFGRLTANISKKESRSVTRQLQFKISWTRAF